MFGSESGGWSSYITLNTTSDKRKHFYSEPEDQSRGEGEFKTLEGGAAQRLTTVSHCNTVSESHTEHRFIGPQIQGGREEKGGQRLNYVAFSVSRRWSRWWWIYLPGERGETREVRSAPSPTQTT